MAKTTTALISNTALKTSAPIAAAKQAHTADTTQFALAVRVKTTQGQRGVQQAKLRFVTTVFDLVSGLSLAAADFSSAIRKQVKELKIDIPSAPGSYVVETDFMPSKTNLYYLVEAPSDLTGVTVDVSLIEL